MMLINEETNNRRLLTSIWRFTNYRGFEVDHAVSYSEYIIFRKQNDVTRGIERYTFDFIIEHLDETGRFWYEETAHNVIDPI